MAIALDQNLFFKKKEIPLVLKDYYYYFFVEE